MARWIVVGCLAPQAFAGWTRFDEPMRIVPGMCSSGSASCAVVPTPESILNRASGTGGLVTEYTVVCHGRADRRSRWRYTPAEGFPHGWASVEAHAEIDGEFYVAETPFSFAHDSTVEVRSELLPSGVVKAEINDSRTFDDNVMTVTGQALVLGNGGQVSTTVFLSGTPQMFFYKKVEDTRDGARCIDLFTVRWHTEGDAFLWVDDGLFFPGSGSYALNGSSTTLVVVATCPDCDPDRDQH